MRKVQLVVALLFIALAVNAQRRGGGGGARARRGPAAMNSDAASGLLAGVRRGAVGDVITALRSGLDVNTVVGTRTTFGLPPLHFACLMATPSHLHIVRLLLHSGADPNFHLRRGMAPPIYYAVGLGAMPPKEDEEVDITHHKPFKPRGRWAHALSREQDDGVRAALVRLLVRAGARLDIPPGLRRSDMLPAVQSPLCFALYLGLYPKTVTALLNAGTDANGLCERNSRSDGNITALHYLGVSSYRPHVRSMWNSLLEFGANPTIANRRTQQTPLHFAAIHADPVFVDDVLSFFGDESRTLKTLLLHRDTRGRTIYDIAILRPVYYGLKHVVEKHALRAGLSKTDIRGSTRGMRAPRRPPAPSLEEQRAHAEYGGYKWSPHTSADSGDCDIDVIRAEDMTPKRFFNEYFLLKRPVAVVGNLTKDWPAWTTWRKSEIAKRWGNVSFMAGSIPYGDVFGRKYQNMKIKDFIALKATNASYLDKEPLRDSKEEPWILFQASFGEKAPSLLAQVRHPSIVKHRALEFESAGTQFSLGSFGAGAPFHHHSHAYNVVLYGRKRWFLSPPGLSPFLGIVPEPTSIDETSYFSGLKNSGQSSLSWFHQKYAQLRKKHVFMTCTQLPGTFMFVPDAWAHSTLNMAETVAIAREFSYENEVGALGFGYFGRARESNWIRRQQEDAKNPDDGRKSDLNDRDEPEDEDDEMDASEEDGYGM